MKYDIMNSYIGPASCHRGSNGAGGSRDRARKKGNGAEMKKRTLSLILAALLVLFQFAFTACDNGGGPGDGTESAAGNDGGTDKTPETEGEPEMNEFGLSKEYFEDYKRDDNAMYYGKMGFGGTKASYDKLTLRVNGQNAYVNEFDESDELPEGLYETYGGALGDWKVADDTVKEGNKKLTYSGSDASILTVGNAEWGRSSLRVSFAIEEGGKAELYFCVRDDKNFYRVTVPADGSGVTLAEVKDGKETTISTVPAKEPTGEWIPFVADIGPKLITVYVGGVEMFNISDANKPHVYSGLMGIAQWNTEFYVDNIKVEDSATGKVYYEQDFEDGTFLDTCIFGERNGASWTVASASDWELVKLDDGNTVLHFKNSGVYGAVALFDPKLPEDCKSVKVTYQGYKIAGSEGYAFVWDWQQDSVDANGDGADYYAYNLGGWTGKSGFQTITGGTKVNSEGTLEVGLQNEVWQTVEVYLTENAAFGCFEGKIYETLWYTA